LTILNNHAIIYIVRLIESFGVHLMNFLEKTVFAALAIVGAVNLPGYAHAKTAPVAFAASSTKILFVGTDGKARMIISHANGKTESFRSADGLTWQRVVKPAAVSPVAAKPIVTPVSTGHRPKMLTAAKAANKAAEDFRLIGHQAFMEAFASSI
jgi:hypothetical protein